MNTIKIGTRGSALALIQSGFVKKTLEESFPDHVFELHIIKTTGDKILDSPLSKIGDKGLFTREIEDALLRGEIDMAVHSMKDLPTKLPDGLIVGAVTKREDPRDVFISKNRAKLQDLKPGDMIATSSLRRRSQMLSRFPGIVITDIRGNLNTRMEKLRNNPELKGIILAHAGIIRMHMEDAVSEIISEEIIIPAVGQASLAVEIREGDARIREIVSRLHDTTAAAETECERSFLARLEGGCQVPIAANARLAGDEIVLTGMVASLDGTIVFKDRIQGTVGTSQGSWRDACGDAACEGRT